MGEELLSWLLPGSSAAEAAGLRRVLVALRLLRDDGRARASRAAGPSWARARGELEHLTRRQRRRALEGLLHSYLEAFRGADSFLELEPSPLPYDAAWGELLRDADLAPALPAPAERPAEVVERLIAAGASGGAPPAWSLLWQARARHVFGGGAAAERLWEWSFSSVLGSGAPPPLLARFLAGWVAARLDRFRPAEAWRLFAPHARLAGGDPLLRRLLGWSALLAGELEPARALLRGAVAAGLPRPMVELREDVPAWAPLLAGPAREGLADADPGRRTGRGPFAAALVAVFAVRGERGELAALEVQRALRAAARRRAAALAPPEALASGAELVRWRRLAQASGPEALGGERTAALAQVAVRHEGELAGWIQLESAHGLLPSAAQLALLARAWRPVLLRPSRVELGPGRTLVVRGGPLGEDDPRRDFLAALGGVLGRLDRRRAYWLEPGPGGCLEVLAERGGALADWQARRGGCGLVRTALEERRAARHAGEREAALHRSARAGLAVPLLDGVRGRVLGLLVLESSRHAPAGGAWDEATVAPLGTALASLELRWWCAAFRAEHRRRHGLDLAWDPACRFLRAVEPGLRAALAAGTSLEAVGPSGAGRRTLARWLEFRGLRCAGSSREGPAAIVRVPPLCERRDEMVELVRVLAANAARLRGLAPARFRDEALAALWRQEWGGNVLELEGLIGELTRAHPGGVLGAAEVRAALVARGLGFRERLPSRPASERDLELALDSTRHRNGSANLARAARYLGWAAETLAARLGERWSRAPAESRADS